MANLLFTDFRDLPAHERNLTRWLVLDPGARELFREWKTVAAEAAGALRVYVGRHPNDPQANQLVGELAVHSEHFRQWWAGHRVATRPASIVRLHHPAVVGRTGAAEPWRRPRAGAAAGPAPPCGIGRAGGIVPSN